MDPKRAASTEFCESCGNFRPPPRLPRATTSSDIGSWSPQGQADQRAVERRAYSAQIRSSSLLGRQSAQRGRRAAREGEERAAMAMDQSPTATARASVSPQQQQEQARTRTGREVLQLLESPPPRLTGAQALRATVSEEDEKQNAVQAMERTGTSSVAAAQARRGSAALRLPTASALPPPQQAVARPAGIPQDWIVASQWRTGAQTVTSRQGTQDVNLAARQRQQAISQANPGAQTTITAGAQLQQHQGGAATMGMGAQMGQQQVQAWQTNPQQRAEAMWTLRNEQWDRWQRHRGELANATAVQKGEAARNHRIAVWEAAPKLGMGAQERLTYRDNGGQPADPSGAPPCFWDCRGVASKVFAHEVAGKVWRVPQRRAGYCRRNTCECCAPVNMARGGSTGNWCSCLAKADGLCRRCWLDHHVGKEYQTGCYWTPLDHQCGSGKSAKGQGGCM